LVVGIRVQSLAGVVLIVDCEGGERWSDESGELGGKLELGLEFGVWTSAALVAVTTVTHTSY
jgi:hypothetical protein